MDFDISDDEQEGFVKKRRLENVDTFEVNSDLGSDFEDEEITSEEDDGDDDGAELAPLPPARTKRLPVPPAARRGAAARGEGGAELAEFAVVEGDDEDELDVDDESERERAARRQPFGGAGSDGSGSDESGSEEEGAAGALDEGAHARMLSGLGLARGRRAAPRVRSEMQAEGDFAIGPRAQRRPADGADGADGGGGDGGLTVAKLLGAMGGASEFGALKSRLAQAERAARKLALPAPAQRTDERRSERAAAASVVDAELSKWTGAVKAYREAEVLSFPMDVSQPERASTASLADKFAPRTSLERRVAAALAEHALGERAVAAAESAAVAARAPTPEAARAALSELRKSRELLFHHERKLKRIGKIKSKAYRKVKRKADERVALRAQADALGQMEGGAGGAAAEALTEARRKLEHQRLVERMRQKHRNTSKWARRMLTQRANQADPNVRAALAEQLQLGEELRRREGGAKDEAEGEEEASDDEGDDTDEGASGEEDGEEDEEADPEADAGADAREDLGVGAARGVGGGGVGGGSERAKRRARKRRRALEGAIAQLDAQSAEAEAAAASGEGGAPGGGGGGGLLNLPFMRRGLERRRAEVEAEVRLVRDELALALAQEEDAEGERAAEAQPRSERAAERGRRRAELAAAEEEEGAAAGGGAGPSARKAFDGRPSAAGRAPGARGAKAGGDDGAFRGGAGGAAEGEEEAAWSAIAAGAPSSTFGAFEAAGGAAAGRGSRGAVALGGALRVAPRERGAAGQAEAARAGGGAASGKRGAKERKGGASEGKRPRGTLAQADALEAERAAEAAEAAERAVADGDSDGDGGGGQRLISAAQRSLVELAFPASGLAAEFEAEKAELVGRELPKEAAGPVALPGWGAWAGQGLRPSKKFEARRAEREAELRAKIRAAASRRQDASLEHVQISERRDKKLAKYTLEAVPFPFTSREQYERATRHPLGKEWNTSQSHEQLTQKRLHVAAGALIEPMAQHRKARS